MNLRHHSGLDPIYKIGQNFNFFDNHSAIDLVAFFLVNLMKRQLIFGLFIASLSIPAFAVLPPQYQSIRELQEILQNEKVINKLKVAPIQRITALDDSYGYVISQGECTTEVQLLRHANPPGFMGPIRFSVGTVTTECSKQTP